MKLTRLNDYPTNTTSDEDVSPIYFRHITTNRIKSMTPAFLRNAYENPNILHHPLYNPVRYIPIIYEQCVREGPYSVLTVLFELYVDNAGRLPPECMKPVVKHSSGITVPSDGLVNKFAVYLHKFGADVLAYNYVNLIGYFNHWNNSTRITHSVEQYFVDRPALTKRVYVEGLYAGSNILAKGTYTTNVVCQTGPPTQFVESHASHWRDLPYSVLFALSVIAMLSNTDVKRFTLDDYIDTCKLFDDLDKHDLWMYFGLKLFCMHRLLHRVDGWKQIVSGIVPTLLVRMRWPDYHIALGTAMINGGRTIWYNTPGVEQFVESYERLDATRLRNE